MARQQTIRRGLRNLGLAAAAATALLAPTVADAKFVFPYNHPDLAWYTIETDHFYVHYPVSKKEEGNPYYINPEFAARKMAKVADEMYEPMCAEFDYYLTEKVHIVLLDQSDYLEGFTIPSWDWIEISANPGNYFWRMRGRMEWFSDVLVHEYAHVVSLKQNTPMHEGLQGVLIGGLYRDGIHNIDEGGEFFIGDTDPFWWTEGGAEYWSDNTGYNWWTTSRDTNLRTTVLEDRLLTYDEWITRVEKRDWGDGERGYQGGYSFALYLRERFGEKTYTRFAQTSNERWRFNWETIVEDVTGVHLHQLYDDWKAYLEEKYVARWDLVRDEGEVVGMEQLTRRPDFQYADPDSKDAWTLPQGRESEQMRRRDREDEIERTGGSWDTYIRMSEDGKWYGENAGGLLTISPTPEEFFPAFSGDYVDLGVRSEDLADISDLTYAIPAEFGTQFDFIPGRDAVVLTLEMDELKTSPLHLDTRGYDFKQIAIAELVPHMKKRKHHGEKVEFPQARYPGTDPYTKFAKQNVTFVPNTLRGADPAASPDGQKVAYFEYRDGTLNLVSINLDGSDKKYLTDFDDGTWMQGLDWSPDGTKLVFQIFRNFRLDLYTINADGTDLTPITFDVWEEQDAHWAYDGNIYFSADPEGIFNIYRYEPDTGKVTQLTNVIGAAYVPWLTPQGNLAYMLWTGHGWKSYGIGKAELLESDSTEQFVLEYDEAEVKAFIESREDLSEYGEVTRKYRWGKALMPPTMVPIFKIENDSRANLGLSGGFQLFAQDYAEKHGLFVLTQLGEDPLFMAQYFNQMFYGDLFFTLYHYQAKFDYGYMLDEDNNPETTDDQTVYDGKQHQFVNVGAIGYSYPWNRHFSTFLSGQLIEYGFRTVSDSQFRPFLRQGGVSLGGTFSNVRVRYGSPNPRGGRVIDFNVGHYLTDVVYKPYKGRDTDDGEIFDKYQYNHFEFTWSEFMPAPTFGLRALDFIRKRQHTLQFDLKVGVLDRNVQFNDEFRGGGTHPYYVGNGTIQPNNQFAGYPGYSLSGETMAVASLQYRFPLVQQVNKKMGPLYFYDAFLQFGGTAGNLWSFRPPDPDDPNTPESCYYFDDFGQIVSKDPKGETNDACKIKREIPFVDEAYKNGNYMLFDISTELRVNMTMWGMPWNSFFRVAWGFNEIKGINDVDGDDISDTIDTGVGTNVSAETEKPGPRFYVGIGTGW